MSQLHVSLKSLQKEPKCSLPSYRPVHITNITFHLHVPRVTRSNFEPPPRVPPANFTLTQRFRRANSEKSKESEREEGNRSEIEFIISDVRSVRSRGLICGPISRLCLYELACFPRFIYMHRGNVYDLFSLLA